MSISLDVIRNSLNEKRRDKADQFWLSIFNAAIMFLSIATPLFMTAKDWSDNRLIVVRISVVCMFVTVFLLLLVLRRLVRFYRGVVLEMMPVFRGVTDKVETKTEEWTVVEKIMAGISLFSFMMGIILVLAAMFV